MTIKQIHSSNTQEVPFATITFIVEPSIIAPSNETCEVMAGVHASARIPDLKSGKATPIINSTTLHPRRSPPREVKSLSGHKRQKLSHSPESADAKFPSLAQLKSQSSGSDQSASHWFDKVNEHVPQNGSGVVGYYGKLSGLSLSPVKSDFH